MQKKNHVVSCFAKQKQGAFSAHILSAKKIHSFQLSCFSMGGSTPKGNTVLVCRRAFEFLAYTQKTLAQNVYTPSIIPSAKEAH